ncbi:MAG: class I SAM-dependent methyltransferase [Candidatus Thorarchaeota archaeon]|jgi:ubiquinone/menaquinone biosynthesis C-methylase UbiE
MVKMRVYEPPPQKIQLERIEKKGLIIDIGGGGEGLVSRIEGTRVYAVDIQLNEIKEARIHNPPSNWFVADGTTLPFREGMFDVASLWFSLGYMKDWEVKRSVLQEAHRVLKDDGQISVKAMKIDCDEEKLVFRVDYSLPDGMLSRTGYGVIGQQNQTQETVADCLQDIGFRIIETHDFVHWFSIEGSKSLKSGPIV